MSLLSRVQLHMPTGLVEQKWLYLKASLMFFIDMHKDVLLKSTLLFPWKPACGLRTPIPPSLGGAED